jgi:hypothetical protein
MRRKGIDNFRRANHLTWRYADPKRDVDASGDPIHSGYAVPVRAADCEVLPPNEDNGRLYYDSDSIAEAPCLKGLRFSRSNMAYGPWRRQTRGRYFHVAAETCVRWFDVYWTCPVYWVEDNVVYRGTVYRHTDPQEKAA